MPDFFSHLLSVPAFSKPKMASTSSTCFSEKHGGRNRRRFTTLEVIEMLQTEGSDVEESDDDSESDVVGEENDSDDLDETLRVLLMPVLVMWKRMKKGGEGGRVMPAILAKHWKVL